MTFTAQMNVVEGTYEPCQKCKALTLHNVTFEFQATDFSPSDFRVSPHCQGQSLFTA